jgi:hypothetical protein
VDRQESLLRITYRPEELARIGPSLRVTSRFFSAYHGVFRQCWRAQIVDT